jgi:2,4-dienoyl-CoA reductase-like NADH-dependent reductase (Old Yellow Enzyme family)
MPDPHAHLHDPVRIGSHQVRNRLYRAPVLEGAGDGDDAAERYAKHFVENARHGVGMIIQGSSCILPEGRTSPGMTCVDTREKALRMAPMVDAVHAEGASIVIQLGHGGLYSMEAWHEPYASARTGPILAASPPRWFLRPSLRGVPVHVMTTDEVITMCRRYGEVAAWCREAGYDAVQLGSANAKLLDQFLSPFYNRRDDRFGGPIEARASVLRLIREAIAECAGADFPVMVKVPVEVGPPIAPHTTQADALRLCRLVEEWGFDAVTPVEVSVFPDTTLSRGGVPDSFWNNPGIVKRLAVAAPSRVRRGTIKAGAWVGARGATFEPPAVVHGGQGGGRHPGARRRWHPDRGRGREHHRGRRGRPRRNRASLLRRTRPGAARPRRRRRCGAVRQLQPVRAGPDAGHEGHLLQPRGGPDQD